MSGQLGASEKSPEQPLRARDPNVRFGSKADIRRSLIECPLPGARLADPDVRNGRKAAPTPKPRALKVGASPIMRTVLELSARCCVERRVQP